MHIQPFYDPVTATISYVVSDPDSGQCAIIDPVLDYDPAAGTTDTASADRIIAYVQDAGLTVAWLLETHIHADHLTAAAYLKQRLGGTTGIGARITEVLDYWIPVFNTAHDTPADGTQFDRLFQDGDAFTIGKLGVRVMHTPGHTPACISYIIGDAIFVGDTIFMPYMGTSRTDFPGGDAATLYRSIRKILALPETTRVFTGHDYPPQDGEPAWECTVGEQRETNILIHENVAETRYIEMRQERDHRLAVPRLILPSIQVNLRAGALGEPEENGRQYIKIPLNLFARA